MEQGFVFRGKGNKGRGSANHLTRFLTPCSPGSSDYFEDAERDYAYHYDHDATGAESANDKAADATAETAELKGRGANVGFLKGRCRVKERTRQKLQAVSKHDEPEHARRLAQIPASKEAKVKASSPPVSAWLEDEFPVLPGRGAALLPLGAAAPRGPLPSRGSPAPRRASPAPCTVPAGLDQCSIAEVEVPTGMAGVIIGRRGSVINMIKAKTNVKSINLHGPNTFRIEGKRNAVALAKQAVEDLIDTGLNPLSVENFTKDVIKVPSSAVPDLIGREGCIIRAIKDTLSVGIQTSRARGPPGSDPEMATVIVAGRAENVRRATEVVGGILMYPAACGNSRHRASPIPWWRPFES